MTAQIAHLFCPACQPLEESETRTTVAFCGFQRPPKPVEHPTRDDQKCPECREIGDQPIIRCHQCNTRLRFTAP